MWYYVSGLEHSGSDWITTEIEVRIRKSHGDDDFVNQAGVIRNISVGLFHCFPLFQSHKTHLHGAACFMSIT